MAVRMGVSRRFGRGDRERSWGILTHESVEGILGGGGCMLRVHQAVLR
jgi:hypothetical protein